MIIIGSGPSSTDFTQVFTQHNQLDVMAVNGAGERFPGADYFFTLDPSEINIHRLKTVSCEKKYLAYNAFSMVEARKHNINLLYRVSVDPNSVPSPKEKGSPEWWMWRWGCKPGLSESLDSVHTGNSMYGALNLAFNLIRHSKTKSLKRKIVLVGLDGTREARVEGGEPNCLLHLPPLFESAVDQLRFHGFTVVNANPYSRVDCFTRMNHQEALEWYQR